MQTNVLQLEKAYNLVSNNWFPFDQSVLGELNSKIKDETATKEEILLILKKDASLFLLCLKEVLSAPNIFGASEPTREFTKYLENASLGQLQQSLEGIAKRSYTHTVASSTNFQKQRLSEMIVSSQTADKLSANDPDINEVACSCSMMRQLGLTLIAWNYPRIFEKVTSKTQSKDALDSDFAAVLGFTPMMLACTVLEKWGLPQYYIEAVKDRSNLKNRKAVESSEQNGKDVFSRVSNICAAGEALARATNPTLYSTAEADIELASEYIESFLGEEGVIDIISSAREKLDDLALEVPPLLQSRARAELDEKIKNKIKGDLLLSKNPYLGALPQNVLHRVSKLYQEIIPNSPAYSSVSLYAKEIFPISGFITLQVYLFDPFERKLYPSLVLGKSKSLIPKNIYLKSLSGQYDLLAEALKTKTPITNSQFFDQGEEISIFASSLGDASTVGVMYVEMLRSKYEKIATGTDLDSLKYFKAFKILLSDCLGLL